MTLYVSENKIMCMKKIHVASKWGALTQQKDTDEIYSMHILI